ncbi:MAG: GTP cyclohydrolase I [Candidatus Dormiibacterota bacterium]
MRQILAREDEADWEERRPRELSEAQWQRYEGQLGEILEALGLEPDTPGTRETPRRLLQALYDATQGYEGDEKVLTTFPTETPEDAERIVGQVVEGPIGFHALCEHHALPFFGSAFVGYLPADRIIGISKLTRLVRLYGQRFTLQERLGRQIADGLDAILAPHGAAVYLEAQHLCTQMRGVRDLETRTRTTLWRGAFETNAELREEFLRAIELGR